jgi:8-oxo-dGTP diphosphatase
MPKPTDFNKHSYMFSDDMKFLQKAVVFHPTEAGKFLAIKRSPDAHARPGDWDLVGGNVLFGELHEEALHREIREETGLEVDEKLVPTQVITNFKDEIYYLYINYATKALSDSVILSEEHTEWRWVDKEEFIMLKPAQFLVDSVETAMRCAVL